MNPLQKFHAGDPLPLSASFFNRIVDLVNAAAPAGSAGDHASRADSLRISFVNTSNASIPQFSAIAFSDPEDLLRPVFRSASADEKSPVIAIVQSDVPAHTSGKAVVLGYSIANVSVSDIHHTHAKLDANGTLVSASVGPVFLLTSPEDTGASLLPVFLTGGFPEPYSGPFAVSFAPDGTLSVSAGYLTRNGTFSAVPAAAGIPPSDGILCLCSTLAETEDGAWTWTDPVFRVDTPAADAFPVAEIAGTSVRQFPVSVAVILLAQSCPMAKL